MDASATWKKKLHQRYLVHLQRLDALLRARQAARNRLDAQTMQTIDDLEWHDRKSVLAGRYEGVQAWGSLAQNV